jgi:uncharacterized membrane protein (DUF4010 family)
MNTVPDIRVPADPDMAEEPALTIGELFANKAMVQPVVAAALAVMASITGWVADDEVVTNVTTLVTFAAIVWGVISAQITASRRAMQQAKQTREAVYAPETVASLVSQVEREVA